MRLLVLGGTSFVGKCMVTGAVAQGWSVTTFNRGLGRWAHPLADRITGDRLSLADLGQLCGWSVGCGGRHTPRCGPTQAAARLPVRTRFSTFPERRAGVGAPSTQGCARPTPTWPMPPACVARLSTRRLPRHGRGSSRTTGCSPPTQVGRRRGWIRPRNGPGRLAPPRPWTSGPLSPSAHRHGTQTCPDLALGRPRLLRATGGWGSDRHPVRSRAFPTTLSTRR
jgi:hypothetical protein